MSDPLTGARRIVVKIGSALLVDADALRRDWLKSLCADVAALRRDGKDVILVSSGAIALGRRALKLRDGALKLEESQAAAAAGQVRLAEAYADGLAVEGFVAAQILLTLSDTEERRRYLNARATLRTLLALGAVPVINENDSVATAEIRFGDNDRLAARVASMMEADCLVLLSDVDGLYSADPTRESAAHHIAEVARVTPEIEAMAGGTTSETAVGGMVSKIAAAKIATRAGCGMFIALGSEPDIVPRLFQGTGPGTFFVPSGLPLEAKKRWLAFAQRPTGTIRINAQAVRALREQGHSLLAVGVTGASGDFAAGDVVNIAGPDGIVMARGTSSFSSGVAAELAGKKSEEVRALCPGRKHLEIVHRDALALL